MTKGTKTKSSKTKDAKSIEDTILEIRTTHPGTEGRYNTR